MSIPVVEIEHIAGDNCIGCPFLSGDDCIRIGRCPECAPDCPACAVEANNKAWAKLLVGLEHWGLPDGFERFYIQAADWEQIKKLAEEKVNG